MGLTQLNFTGMNKQEHLLTTAIARMKEFEPPEGYYLAFSGGKDSTVIYDLAVKSGVKFDAHYHRTGIDPPELVQHIKRNYPNMDWTKPNDSMWNLIVKRGMPIRVNRWCCVELKEGNGKGRRLITGIRWAESARRSTRALFEVCRKDKTRYFLNAIIDWTEKDVWDYINSNKLPYCSLYDEMIFDTRKQKMVRKFKRLGCVLCPMTTARQALIEAERFPKIADAWKRAAERLYNRRVEVGTESVKRWNDFESFWQWWLSRKSEPKVNDAQCFMLDN